MKEVAADFAQSVGDARKLWGWYFALGVVLILVGLYCIWAEGIATLASVLVLGVVLFVAGIAQIIGAFMARGAGHVILLLLVGALDIIVGLMLFEHPGIGALTITLFLAALFIFGGIFRFVSALALQFANYGWVAFGGIVSIILGILLWTQWPVSAIWFIGFVVGLNFVFSGFAWAIMGWKLKPA
ncbi:MAG: HdeD family acid-resistance protein [Candidatus Cybelea sp.]|jgi:uncharacterized membrane protein HdeD (DUF308 family)